MEHATRFGGSFVAALQSNPSFFDLLAADSMRRLFPPLLHSLVHGAASQFPEHLSPLLNWFDEFYAVVATAINLHCLRNTGGTMSENYHGIHRRGSVLEKENCNLSSLQLGWSIFETVMISYWQTKLERKLRTLQDSHVPLSPSEMRFLRFYPYIHASWELLNWIYNFAYVYGLGRHFSPIQHLAGILLGRSASAVTSSSKLTNLLPNIMFVLRFFQWWYQSGLARTSTLNTRPVPPAPSFPVPKTSIVITPATCPICQCRPCKNPTALPTGYVYCAECIAKQLLRRGWCPVTNIKMTLSDMRPLYVSM